MLQVALRLTATADDLPRLEQALLKMTIPNATERTTVTSTYYDTATGGLDRVGLALQVQKQNGRYKQTVTTAELKEQPPLTRCEWEDCIDRERPDLRAPNSSAHLPAALYRTGLRLLEIAPLRIELRSKPERGCRLLENTTDEPQAQHSLPFDLK